jgi:hypothetical protein
MLYFPQLSSGATGQYPLRKRSVERTIVNRVPDGRSIKSPDAGATLLEWQLAFQNLNDGEIEALQQFFSACEGRLTAFTFLTPVGNLLAWSEELAQPVWQTSTLLQLSAGASDPNGGSTATRITNPTASDLTLQQAINAPGWFSYCFSTYVRGQSGTSVSLFLHAGTASVSNAWQVQPNWTRIALSGKQNTTAESTTAGIIVAAGQSLDIFGLQLEPQPAASPYKPTFSANGVYSNAHFSEDFLDVTTTAPNHHSCTLTITAR